MPFIPNTENDRLEMLRKIGVADFEELFSNIPKEILLKKPLNLMPQLSEYEVIKLLEAYSSKNKTAATHVCFMGGGSYDHFIPSIVSMVLDRSEFKTAYTPYQAEVSQGTLQAMYEFQSLICTLTGMDVSNASMYDGGTSLAEACLMANAQNKRNEIFIAGSLNPNYKKVIHTLCAGRELLFSDFIADDGTSDLNGLSRAISRKTSAVIVQHPNMYGNLEEVFEIEKIAHSNGAMFISVINPISLGLIHTPGEYNADIAVGEGQSLGIPMSFGGLYLGIFATKHEFVRKIPGRLSGMTADTDGKRAFVLTLQTREQQIKREKATSNICTNQGLFMLASTVFMETMGRQGIIEIAQNSYQKAHYLASEIIKIPGFSLLNNKAFFNEFLIKTPVPATKILDAAEEAGILGGIDTSKFQECKEGLLIAVTEKRSKQELDSYLDLLRNFQL